MPKKLNKAKSPSAPNFPPHHPEALANLAEGMPWKKKVRLFEVSEYTAAICKLQDRGYSYEEIAQWLNERLKDKLGEKIIKRGQVYRVYQQWLVSQDPLNESLSVPHISDEEAETKAAKSDQKPREMEKEKTP